MLSLKSIGNTSENFKDFDKKILANFNKTNTLELQNKTISNFRKKFT